MDACPISPRDFLNAHYVTIFKNTVTVFFKEILTENMRSILEDPGSKIYRKNLQKTLQFTQILLPL